MRFTEHKIVNFGPYGELQYHNDYPLFEPALEVIRWMNAEEMSQEDNFLGFVTPEKQCITITLERPMENGRFLK